MAINHRPKVGEILECDFGQWANPETVDGDIKPEMIKKRLVVVLNGDIDGKGAVVVPISSTKAYGRIATFHQYLPPELIQETSFYEKRDRWAKAEHTHFISTKRLYYIFDNGKKLTQKLPNDVVTEIQKKVLIAVSGKRILDTMQQEIDQLKEQLNKIIDTMQQEINQLKERLNNQE